MSETMERRTGRFLGLMIAVGVAGALSMAFVPIEQLLPAGMEAPRALLLVQPVLLVAALSALGWWASPKLGLDAPVLGALADGGDWAAPLHRALIPALTGGIGCGALIALFGMAAADVLGGRAQSIELPLATRMLYGGTVEEIVFRWALLPLAALGLVRLGAGRPAALWLANGIAALLFAAGHVPGVLQVVAVPPSWLVPAVLAANSAIGLICGWLFIRRGFEAAMIAHALAHLVSLPLLALA